MDAVSTLFHSGFAYIFVSAFFVIATCYGIYIIKDIKNLLIEMKENKWD